MENKNTCQHPPGFFAISKAPRPARAGELRMCVLAYLVKCLKFSLDQ